MRLIAVFLGLLAFALQPVQAASSPKLTSLEQQLRSLVGSQVERRRRRRARPHHRRDRQHQRRHGLSRWPARSRSRSPPLISARSTTAAARSTTRIAGQSAYRLMERMMIHSDNRATDILIRDLGGPKGLQDWVAVQRPAQPARRPHDRAAAGRQARPLGLPRFQHAAGDGRTASAARQGQCPEAARAARYLLDLMGRCATGKNRIRGAAALGHAGREQDRARSTATRATSASSPCPTAAGSRSRCSPAAEPTARARSPRRRAPSTTASPACSAGQRSASGYPVTGRN